MKHDVTPAEARQLSDSMLTEWLNWAKPGSGAQAVLSNELSRRSPKDRRERVLMWVAIIGLALSQAALWAKGFGWIK